MTWLDFHQVSMLGVSQSAYKSRVRCSHKRRISASASVKLIGSFGVGIVIR